MKVQSKWLLCWRAVSVAALVGSMFLVPACGSGGPGGLGSGGSPGGQPGSFPTNPIGPDPLSAVVAAFIDPSSQISVSGGALASVGGTATDLSTYVRALVFDFPNGNGSTFPVQAAATDSVRSIQGVKSNVVVRWLDTLTFTVPGRINLVHDVVNTALTLTENVGNSNFSVSTTAGSATTAATGRIQAVHGYQITETALVADFFTVTDGVNPALKFEFDSDGVIINAGAIAITYKRTWNVNRIVMAMTDAVNKVGSTLAVTALEEPIYGAHPDFIGYFGDDYNLAAPQNPPQWNGSGDSAWLWTNHEYITTNEFPNFDPAVGLAPRGQELVLSKWMRERGLIDFDPAIDANWDQAAVDLYIRMHKKSVGGSYFHVVRDPSTGEWAVDKNAANRRFDGTSNTLSLLTGQTLSAAGHDDFGNTLASGVISGTAGNCSGVVSPWGTIFCGEENIQDYYGDFEAWWDGNNQFVPGKGMDSGAAASPTFAPSLTSNWGLISDANGRQQRDILGYNVEIDPSRPSNEKYAVAGNGFGHRKMGSWGRARWENVTFFVDSAWKLVANQPMVMYGGDDRRGGRIYKWVSGSNVTPGMVSDMVTNRASIRTLLDTGKLFVAQFNGVDNKTGWAQAGTTTPFTAAGVKGNGKWIELSTSNVTDDAPNAAVLGAGTKVGTALTSISWNGMASLPDDTAVRRAVFTAANKIGVFEMNRPEEMAYNPVDKTIYVSLTNFSGRPPVLGPDGVMGEVVVVPEVGSTTTTITEGVANAGFKVVATAANRAVIVAVPGNLITAADTLTVNDGVNDQPAGKVFTFIKTGTPTSGQILAADTDNAQAVASNIITAINAVAAGLNAAASGAVNTTAGRRTDTVGRIWAMQEANTTDPSLSSTFTFWEVFTGTSGTGLFDAANPDNLAITKDGFVWFGTDGNYGTNGRSDAVYFLDMTKTHPTVVNAQGRAYRVLACPADAEHTGPCFSKDMKTLFNSIQHPGEFVESTWPNGQP